MGRKLVWGEGANRANQEPVTANKTSTAGARTSVSAPLGICRETLRGDFALTPRPEAERVEQERVE